MEIQIPESKFTPIMFAFSKYSPFLIANVTFLMDKYGHQNVTLASKMMNFC